MPRKIRPGERDPGNTWQCWKKRCRNERGHGGKSRLCHKHERQRQKEINPTRYYFDHHRNNARNRRIPWQITIEQFRDWCARTDFISMKQAKDDWTINRIDARKGYKIDNIEIVTRSANSKQQWRDYYANGGQHPGTWNDPIDDTPPECEDSVDTADGQDDHDPLAF
jgi:hypothetical protein